MGRNHLIYPKYDKYLGKVYDGMIDRCYKPSCPNYKSYGRNGVRVCEEWRNSRAAFYKWAFENGWRKGLQIDKDIKGNGLLYSPETCCIVTREENNAHRKYAPAIKTRYFEYNGEARYLNDICSELNINPSTILSRMSRGIPFKEAISFSAGKMPPKDRPRKTYKLNGENRSLKDICKEYGLNYGTVHSRLKRTKCSIEEALYTPTYSSLIRKWKPYQRKIF